MVDLLWTSIGFVVGVAAAGIAVELGLKKLFSAPETNKLTTAWSLAEFPTPWVAAKTVESIKIPKNTRLVTAQTYAGARDGFDLRKNPEVAGSFAVDANLPRGLLFLGDVKPGTLALWTVDERLIERLRAEFNRHWSRSTDHVERVAVGQVSGKPNLTIQTEGTVADVIPYRGNFLMRLTDGGETVGVMVDKELPLRGRRVSVTGVVRASSSGYPLVEAVEVQQVAA